MSCMCLLVSPGCVVLCIQQPTEAKKHLVYIINNVRLRNCPMASPVLECTNFFFPTEVESFSGFASMNWTRLPKAVLLLFSLESICLQRGWIPTCCQSCNNVGRAGCASTLQIAGVLFVVCLVVMGRGVTSIQRSLSQPIRTYLKAMSFTIAFISNKVDILISNCLTPISFSVNWC